MLKYLITNGIIIKKNNKGEFNMKKGIKTLVSLVLIIILSLSLASCNKNEVIEDLWANAIYKEDTELGNGQKTVLVDVVTPDKKVTFTIHSDKKTLGEALNDHKLIEGEQGAYGLYVKKVNGILADYDINQTYWGLNKNGESMMTGVDQEEFKGGEHYELVYTKQ